MRANSDSVKGTRLGVIRFCHKGRAMPLFFWLPIYLSAMWSLWIETLPR
jgi:hypothetical protein